ncbi:MAG: thioredoxin family protein, partial [Phycisphaerales bacterium]|nr:thioredoxin family protein [Phycisphaerales bacterium]
MKFVYTVIAALAIAFSVTSSEAAPRKVIAENFTATWCTYCPDVANGLIMLQDEFPDTFFAIQVHGSDAYSTTWGDLRQVFYSVPGFPTVWMDGVISQVGSYGSPSGNYTQLRTKYLQRIATAT